MNKNTETHVATTIGNFDDIVTTQLHHSALSVLEPGSTTYKLKNKTKQVHAVECVNRQHINVFHNRSTFHISPEFSWIKISAGLEELLMNVLPLLHCHGYVGYLHSCTYIQGSELDKLCCLT